jgi:hypothetical protein
MPIYRKSGEQMSAVMVPTGNGLIDVVNDYTWTLSNNKNEVPTATLKEYQINSGQLLAGIYYYSKQLAGIRSSTSVSNLGRGGGAVKNPYEFMYFATPTNFTYSLPYLDGQKFGRTSTFSDSEGKSGLGEIGKTVAGYGSDRQGSTRLEGFINKFRDIAAAGTVLDVTAKTIGVAAGKVIPGKIGLSQAKSWEGTAGVSYTINFQLLNTFKDTNEIRKNRELAYLLTYQNSPFRRNIAVVDPVCIYSLTIPDVVHFPACFVDNLAVSNLGHTRLLDLDGHPRVIPEAYQISLTLSSLVEESRNIFEGVDNPNNRISAISTEHAWDAIRRDTPNLLRQIVTGTEFGPNTIAGDQGDQMGFDP